MTHKPIPLSEIDELSIEEIHDLYTKFVNPNQTKIFSSLPYGNEIFERGEGSYLYTKSGKKILDFTGGEGVLSLGHNHPRIINARINYQKENRVEVHKIYFSKYMAALSKTLANILPEKLNKSFFLNSGAEAVEAAIKVCFRNYNSKKKNILHANNSYHGKLIGTGTISGSYTKKNLFPIMENSYSFEFNNADNLEYKIKHLNKNGGVYAVIIEPYSVSSLTPYKDDFIQKLYQLKEKYDFKIIFDEVYSGFYKSKKMFYFENYKNVVPDVICLSKALGGGKSSISCLVVEENLYKSTYGKIDNTFLHTTTYNGFGEESITALESINIMCEDNFEKRVYEIAEKIKKKLSDLIEKHNDKIEYTKGTGIINGIVFKSFSSKIGDITEKFPIDLIKNKSYFLKKITTTTISSELFENYNILTSVNDSPNSNHLKVSPALIIEDNDINYFFQSIDDLLSKNISIRSINRILEIVKKL